MSSDKTVVGVLGLGYVGLPLAVAFAAKYSVVGFDTNPERIAEIGAGTDSTQEVDDVAITGASGLVVTGDERELDCVNRFIVTVPTPIDEFRRPDLRHILAATRTVGRHIRRGGVVVYESTVYPGATEECCVPVLEEASGLVFNVDFFVGYSPERINPGDALHRFEDIVKVTSGSTPEAAELVDALYREVVLAGTHRAPSIRVAEAAKVIENIQRDVNIALVNELAILFDRLGIETQDVLEAAGTKWNFLRFYPGLVGGHCIGVDPYYLTHKAQSVGYHPEIISAGRRINDSMPTYVAHKLLKEMILRGCHIQEARVLIMGLTFKENTPDLRNSKVADVVNELRDHGVVVEIEDPWADPDDAERQYGFELVAHPEAASYDAVVVAVAHRQYLEMGSSVRTYLREPAGVLFDVKGIFDRSVSDLRM